MKYVIDDVTYKVSSFFIHFKGVVMPDFGLGKNLHEQNNFNPEIMNAQGTGSLYNDQNSINPNIMNDRGIGSLHIDTNKDAIKAHGYHVDQKINLEPLKFDNKYNSIKTTELSLNIRFDSNGSIIDNSDISLRGRVDGDKFKGKINPF